MSKIFPFTWGRGGRGGGRAALDTKIFFFRSEHVSSQIWCQKIFPLLGGGAGQPLTKKFFPVRTCIKPNLVSKIFPFTGGGPLNKKIFSQPEHVSSKIWCQKIFPLLRPGTPPWTVTHLWKHNFLLYIRMRVVTIQALAVDNHIYSLQLVTGNINRRAVSPAGLLYREGIQNAQKAKPSQLEHLPAGLGGGAARGTPLLYLRSSCCIPLVLNSLVVTLIVLLSPGMQAFYRVYLTTGISSTLKQIVPKGPGGMLTIPYTLD